jgi:hypothetical protein
VNKKNQKNFDSLGALGIACASKHSLPPENKTWMPEFGGMTVVGPG